MSILNIGVSEAKGLCVTLRPLWWAALVLETDVVVGAVAERLVLRLAAAAERVAVPDCALGPRGVEELHGTAHFVGTILPDVDASGPGLRCRRRFAVARAAQGARGTLRDHRGHRLGCRAGGIDPR